MTKKVWVMIGAIVAAAAAVVVACVVLIGGKNEAYRSIMVYQVNGNATITRERVGEMEAYENLMLQSGDTVAVGSDSSMRLKLDDDKYVLAEQDTLMNIVADGNDENARTYIDLQKGSVTSEIQNKLKDGASYEVNTPNSIMAVRGTIFRVDVEMDANKNTNTKLTVFQGTVGVRTIMPDGTVSEEEIKVEAGNELTVEGTPTTSEYSGEPVEIDYDSLPPIIKDYIDELAQSGMKPGRDAAANTSKTQQSGQEEAVQAETNQPDEKHTEPEQENAEESQQEEPEQPESIRLQTTQPETPAKPKELQPKSEVQNAEQPETTQPAVTESQEAESQKTEPQSKPQSTAPQTDQSSQQSSGGGSKGKTQYYTVTFQYNGSTFGTQRVKKGEKATEPKLCPTENGAWDYDFSKKVNKNITVQWVEK